MLMMHLDTGRGALFELGCSDESLLRLRFFCFRALRSEARRRAREVMIAPSRFVRRVWEMSVGEILGRRLLMEMPAALMRMSTVSWNNRLVQLNIYI